MSTITIFYDYFSPAYKAGGPTQSLANLVQYLEGVLNLEVVCRDRDHDGTLLEVDRDCWIHRGGSRVFYAATPLKASWLRQLPPANVIYVNGLYSPRYNLLPLLYTRTRRKIVATRGMLHPGALSQKALKKKLYLAIWKILGLHRKVEFHATAPEEADYIRNYFGSAVKVWTIPNFPRVLPFQIPQKQAGSLHLTSIALISPMKNHLLVIEALKSVTDQIVWDIFGPVKDLEYWTKCQIAMQDLPDNIQVCYHGDVPPSQVPETLRAAHIAILPSRSENFGHSIFEALTAGKPVITSHNTPWNGLREKMAGINVSVQGSEEIASAISFFAKMGGEEFSRWTEKARKFALDATDIDQIKAKYLEMFGG